MPRLLALLLPLLLASCFDIREEVRLEPDGSGRLTFDYTFPASALAMVGGEPGIRAELDTLLADIPEARVESLQLTRDDGEAQLHIEIGADSMLALMDVKQTEAFENLPSSSRELAGTFDVRLDGLQVAIDRRLDVARALGLARLGIGREERASRKLEYIIHLPKAATESNADLVENDGRTLIWRRSLGEALESPLSMRYTAPLPLPAWLLPAAIVLLLLILWLAVTLFRRLRRKRNTAG